jgi:hypothetical protein
MNVRFTMAGDGATQIGDRYVCYLLGVLVGEIEEALAAAWHFADRHNREMMVVWLLKAMVASDDARKYSAHRASSVSGIASKIWHVIEPLYQEHDRKKGDLDRQQIEALRPHFRRAGRLSEDLARETSGSCGAM